MGLRGYRALVFIIAIPTVWMFWYSSGWWVASPSWAFSVSTIPNLAALAALYACAVGLVRPGRGQRRLLVAALSILIPFQLLCIWTGIALPPASWAGEVPSPKAVKTYQVDFAMLCLSLSIYVACIPALLRSSRLVAPPRPPQRPTDKKTCGQAA